MTLTNWTERIDFARESASIRTGRYHSQAVGIRGFTTTSQSQRMEWMGQVFLRT